MFANIIDAALSNRNLPSERDVCRGVAASDLSDDVKTLLYAFTPSRTIWQDVAADLCEYLEELKKQKKELCDTIVACGHELINKAPEIMQNPQIYTEISMRVNEATRGHQLKIIEDSLVRAAIYLCQNMSFDHADLIHKQERR